MSEQPDAVDLDTLTYTDEPAPQLPRARAEDVKIPRTVRLPVDLDVWITSAAHERGVPRSDLIRDLLELGRAALQGADRPVSLADVLSALASVPSRSAA